MATHRMSLMGWAVTPDASGNVFFEPASIKATNDQWPGLVCIFNDTSTRLGLRGRFTVPKNYVSAPKIIVVWSATATSGGVRWEFDYRAVGGNDAESLDQSGTQEAVTVNDTAPGAAHRRLEAEMSLTAGNLAVDDEVQFELYRDGSDGVNDTMAAAAMLYALLFEWSDS